MRGAFHFTVFADIVNAGAHFVCESNGNTEVDLSNKYRANEESD